MGTAELCQAGPRERMSRQHALELGEADLPWWKAVELYRGMWYLHGTHVVNYHEVRWW